MQMANELNKDQHNPVEVSVNYLDMPIQHLQGRDAKEEEEEIRWISS